MCLLNYSPSVLWCCWLGDRKGIRPVKNWVVGCWHGYLFGARSDLHMAQLMPLPLTVSCFSKIWYWLTRVVLDKGPLNGCVCACVRACMRACVRACVWINVMMMMMMIDLSEVLLVKCGWRSRRPIVRRLLWRSLQRNLLQPQRLWVLWVSELMFVFGFRV